MLRSIVSHAGPLVKNETCAHCRCDLIEKISLDLFHRAHRRIERDGTRETLHIVIPVYEASLILLIYFWHIGWFLLVMQKRRNAIVLSSFMIPTMGSPTVPALWLSWCDSIVPSLRRPSSSLRCNEGKKYIIC
jgi:hypothetical protein